jgi:phosphopantothenoylcysteine decarboxylase/phosphopantothenate--cysteine ligase
MSTFLQNKSIILGVTGGIAAYKSVELLRLLTKAGARVRVIMTQNAGWFVGPLTFEALSGQSVCTDLFGSENDASITHIDWAEKADAVVIAPATANIVGKLANGIADDALSTFMLAVTSPVLVCPSMNTHMYESRPVQRNLARLKEDGHFVIEPESGKLACGTTGPGRLPEPEDIVDRLTCCLTTKDLQGKRVLVTAGPTQEPIDPVRFISNPSSGKMGFAVARASEHRGAAATLISGPTGLPDPCNVNTIRVQTAQEMAREVSKYMENSDIIIKAAAVADYRPGAGEKHKIKKDGKSELCLVLEKTQDILLELGRKKRHQVLVGFAAETQELEHNAKKKLKEKNLDMIVGNLIGSSDSGFKADTNKVTLFYKDGTAESFDVMEKDAVSHLILDRLLERVLT